MKHIDAFWQRHPGWEEKFWQFARFGVVGTVSSAIHYGVYCLVLAAVGENIAFTLGYAVGFVCNYFLTTYFTFRTRPSSGNALGFGASHVVNYLLEMALLNLFLYLGVGSWLAPLLVLGVVVPVNFLLLYFIYICRGRRRV